MPTRSRRPRRQRPPLRARLVDAPGFVDENEFPRIQVELRPKPRLTLLQDVRALLLLGMRGLFLNVISWRSKKRQITDEEKCSPQLAINRSLDFQQRHIRLTANQSEQIIAMRLNAVRPTIPARRRRGNLAGRPGNAKPSVPRWRCSPRNVWPPHCATSPFQHSVHNTFAKIVRKRHHSPPPSRGEPQES